MTENGIARRPDSSPIPKETEATLKSIRETLRANPDSVVYIGELATQKDHSSGGDPLFTDMANLDEKNGMILEEIKIFVAPKVPTFPAGKLNKFMDELIPGIKPRYVERARWYTGALDIGKLHFTEDLGSIEETTSATVTIASNDQETVRRAGLFTGETQLESTHKNHLERKIEVWICPDQTSGRKAFEYRRQNPDKFDYGMLPASGVRARLTNAVELFRSV